LVPHGIFEIPAILISIGLGLKLGYLIVNTIISVLLGKPTKDNEFKLFFRELKPAFKIILILLCIGAFVEILITPLLITIIGG
jgi:stage II sporulation protein M